MNKLVAFIFSFLFAVTFSQSKIVVKETGEETPIKNASISCNGKILGQTDSEGILLFKTKCKKIKVSSKGYYDDEIITDKIMEAFLTKEDPKTHSIETVVLEDKSDPKALNILQKVNDNYYSNSPKSLDSYTFKSYEKISLDLDQDSIADYNNYIAKRIDSLKKQPEKAISKQKKKDSLESANIMKLMGESKLFLWERASEFLYSKKYGEKINVLDNRISGLKEPLYEMMTLRSNRNQIPREIREENRRLYRYFLTDSISIEGRKNYVIRFRQVDYKQPVQRRKFNGYLYIDSATYALKKIESNSKIKSEGNITSTWKLINNKWFLDKENLKIKMGKTYFDEQKTNRPENEKRKNFGNYVYMTTQYFDYKTPIDEKPKDFRGYTMEIKNSEGKLLNQFRTDSLSAREKATYTKIDSVGNKYNLDQKAKIFGALVRGKLRAGIIDFDLGKTIGYNLYEGFKLGTGIKFNEKFNKYISPDLYVNYGFRDGKLKYGAGIDFKTTLRKNSFFRAEYYHDVLAAGKFSENMWNFRMKLMNAGINLKNDRFYKFEGIQVSYENDITNGLTMNVSAKKDKELSGFNYSFMNLGNEFDNFSTLLTLKYAPKSKNIMTPTGKFTYEQNFPEIYLNYEQGIKTFGGDLSFSRIDAMVLHNFKTKIGVTGVRLYGGFFSGEAPIWHNFTMNGLGKTNESINFNLASYLGFATMEAGKYYNDKFIGYYFTHRLPWYFKSFGKNTSSFDFIYRGAIGNMKNPEYHQLDFEELNHFYQEVGLEYNNFLSTSFNLGFFYRIGHYNTSSFKQDFAIQFKFKFLGF